MYEMEGPRSIAQPSTPIAQLPVARLLSAADRTTSTDTRREFRLPGLSLRSGVSPGTPGSSPGAVSARGGECFSTARPRARTRAFGQQSQDSLAIHRTPAVIPRVSRPSTVYPPVRPQVDPQPGRGQLGYRAADPPGCMRDQRGASLSAQAA